MDKWGWGGTDRHFQTGREREKVQAVSLSDGTAVDCAHGKAAERAESN